MLYSDISNMLIGSSFEINNGVHAVKSSKDTVTIGNGSVYRFEPASTGRNIKFIKVT